MMCGKGNKYCTLKSPGSKFEFWLDFCLYSLTHFLVLCTQIHGHTDPQNGSWVSDPKYGSTLTREWIRLRVKIIQMRSRIRFKTNQKTGELSCNTMSNCQIDFTFENHWHPKTYNYAYHIVRPSPASCFNQRRWDGQTYYALLLV